MLSEHPAQRIGNLTECRARFDGRDDQRNEICGAARGVGQAIQRCPPFRATLWRHVRRARVRPVAARSRVYAEHIDRRRRLCRETVDADDDTFPGVDLLLCTIGGLLYFALDQPAARWPTACRLQPRCDRAERRRPPRSGSSSPRSRRRRRRDRRCWARRSRRRLAAASGARAAPTPRSEARAPRRARCSAAIAFHRALQPTPGWQL